MAIQNQSFFLFLFFFFTVTSFRFSRMAYGQQEYENNKQLGCSSTSSSVLGYTCNTTTNSRSTNSKSCTSYLLFRSSSPSYNSPVDIGYLLNADVRNISTLNSIIDVSTVSANRDILVPITCSCSEISGVAYYQHNASYTIKHGETYFTIANNTYQGLTTCQALIAQNNHGIRNLYQGLTLNVPVRCACPTKNQTSAGYKFLLTYLITWGDYVSSIAKRFNSSVQAVLDANSLSASDTIYPFTTLLVPLISEPINVTAASPLPPPPPPAPATSGSGGGSSSNKGVAIGVGIGASVFVLLVMVTLWWFLQRRRNRAALLKKQKQSSSSVETGRKKSSSTAAPLMISDELKNVMESLAVYNFSGLEKATGSFDEQHRIKGSVYRGTIHGDAAAIKRLKGDVTGEIGILKKINHSSIIRLSGICLHEGYTYLVYEFAERGSLTDWLHHRTDKGYSGGGASLSWTQRVQVAYDIADGLNYLHNYTSPPYVHKDLKSSNILLDSEFRAKIGNFGLARPVNESESVRLTTHVVGTQGYMAPEYLEHGLVTTKLDVFAFGVVILELLSGKEAAFAKEGNEKGEELLWQLIDPILRGEDVRSKLREFMDPCLNTNYPFEQAYTLAQLAKHCVSRDPASRPTADEILVSLSAVYSAALDWDPSDVSTTNSAVHGR